MLPSNAGPASRGIARVPDRPRPTALLRPQVGLAEQHRARQVRAFDPIAVGDEHVPADAQQCEVLDDLVAERAGADHQHAGRGEPLLVPPRDQPEAGEAVVVVAAAAGVQVD